LSAETGEDGRIDRVVLEFLRGKFGG